MDLARLTRGQLVLAAAAVIAVAFVPVLLAYLQLGYHPDVGASNPDIDGETTVQYLDRAVHDVASETAGEYAWDERAEMAATVRKELAGRIPPVETVDLEAGVVRDIEYDPTSAGAFAETNCPRGPGERFGDCRADGGVVIQERAGDATLLAVAFEVDVVGPEAEAQLRIVVVVGEGVVGLGNK